MKSINVFSEIGRLKKVMLHRPGYELENLTPNLLEELLFDDIPWLKKAREEHDSFAKTLRNAGVEVVYLEQLVADILDANSEIKEKFINQFIKESGIKDKSAAQSKVYKYLVSFNSNLELVEKTMAGIRKSEIETDDLASSQGHPFYCDPLPNLYFTRDPFATMGNGVSINRMYTKTRRRETIYGEYIFKYHPDYNNTPQFYSRLEEHSIEGGDILVLSDEIIAIGVSERTQMKAINKFASNLLSEKTTYKKILAFDIPKTRAFMHLDTVFTQLDYDKFTIHPEICGPLAVTEIKLDENDRLKSTKISGSIDEILERYLGCKITLIPCGGDDMIAAAREQWSDGANTLCIAPGEVVVYSRNEVTNKLLEENGIKLHIIPSSELSRGRGGPRCMSMPLIRE